MVFSVSISCATDLRMQLIFWMKVNNHQSGWFSHNYKILILGTSELFLS